MNGPLVVISGAPGSGKTTLARPLAERLDWPLLAKDVIKEVLYDELGTPRTRRRSKRLGSAAFEVLYALVDATPRAVLETHWHPQLSVPRLLAMERPLLEVSCRCDRSVRVARLGTRERHPGHLESRLNLVPTWLKERMPLGYEEPLGLGGPLLEVATDAPVDVDEVASWVRSHVR